MEPVMLEVLSPAGSMESLRAAVQNGADSVYLSIGYSAVFNNSFSSEALEEAVRYCHIRGVLVYLSLDTLIADKEIYNISQLVRLANITGVDAIIVRDTGLISLIRHIAPQLAIFSDSRLGCDNLAGVRAASDFGAGRVSIAPQLSRERLAYICRSSPIEIEVLALGVLCASYPGRCYLSAFSGKSAARGVCPMNCKKNYSVNRLDAATSLSYKELNLLGHLKELESLGVCCVKIGHFSDSPQYCALATKIFAASVKEGREPSPEDISSLGQMLSGRGLTDGFYSGKTNLKANQSKAKNVPLASYSFIEKPCVPVRYYAVIKQNAPVLLAVEDDKNHICTAKGSPATAQFFSELTEDALNAILKEADSSPYYCTESKSIIEPGLVVQKDELDALRLRLLDRLTELRTKNPVREEGTYREGFKLLNSQTPPVLTISITSLKQVTPELQKLSPEVFYIPLSETAENSRLVKGLMRIFHIAVSMPQVVSDSEAAKVRSQLDTAYALGIREALTGNWGQLELLRSRGFTVRGDFGLNLSNSLALETAKKAGLISAVACIELSLSQLRELSKPLPLEAPVYGRLPLMVTEECIIKSQRGGCFCGEANYLVSDGGRFPLARDVGTCRNLILSPKPIYMGDKYFEFSQNGLWAGRLMFTQEENYEVAEIVQSFLSAKKLSAAAQTRGFYYRGMR